MKNKFTICAIFIVSVITIYCPHARGCPIKIDSSIESGWEKLASYEVSGNILTITGNAPDKGSADSDSIYIGTVDNSNRNCKKLKIIVQEISGSFPWGGKAIGITLSGRDQECKKDECGKNPPRLFPEPRGYRMDDRFIKGALSKGKILEYDIDGLEGIIHIGAKVFVGHDNKLKLQFATSTSN